MEQSILKSTKKILNISPDDDGFDIDVITHINTAFTSLAQLGIGPANGFMIDDDSAEWTDFIGGEDHNLNSVRSYVYLKTRSYFDPPTTSYHLSALDSQLKELEWRLNVHRENLGIPAGSIVLDGGSPTSGATASEEDGL